MVTEQASVRLDICKFGARARFFLGDFFDIFTNRVFFERSRQSTPMHIHLHCDLH